MKQEIYIENLKCGGCANTIINGLKSINEVSEVNVNVEKSLVTLFTNEATLLIVKEKLSRLGYPEVGDKNTVFHKAKSFVSCAVGKVNKS
ncbi:heavy-metal-associated domain-containing protein [Tenacibaculum ovolyticum]|uniref:heavy-metal-associated domain-containing protein n=1 Tax=Tenacibaculum ovolyticum TaxID=104270 RepID=UPI00040D6672|nr:heavy-metal-associated domain-containing protein [Tenacibaculum ovolyticum]